MTAEESNALLDNISNTLSEHCPRVFADAASLTVVADKIKSYTLKLERAPSIDAVLAWAQPLESDLKQKADEQAAAYAAEQERIEARERERAEYLSGSGSDKAQAVADLKGRSPVPECSSVFVPKREYTDEEIDRMSADEMAIKLFGRNNIEDRQGSSGGYVVRPERLERRVRKIKLSPEEKQARVYRERVIQEDKEARKRVMQDLRKAQEAGRK